VTGTAGAIEAIRVSLHECPDAIGDIGLMGERVAIAGQHFEEGPARHC
jgi:hypothetical protein